MIGTRKFREAKLGKPNLFLLEQAARVVAEYTNQGYTLTLRQLYYQMVSRDLMANNKKAYENFSKVISEGRMNGVISWGAIQDRTRRTIIPAYFNDTNHLIHSALESFRLDRMIGQYNYIEVLVEKDALSGILEPITNYYGIPFTAIKGDASTSFTFDLHRRLTGVGERQINVLYLGDLDPSGIRIPVSLNNKLKEMGTNVNITRIALSPEQVEEVGAPENPVKLQDSNAQNFIRQYGNSSYELDALPPAYLEELLHGKIKELLDPAEFNRTLEREEFQIKELKIKLNK